MSKRTSTQMVPIKSLNPREAIVAFVGWMGTRPAATGRISLSAADNMVGPFHLATQFADAHKMPLLREGHEQAIAKMDQADDEVNNQRNACEAVTLESLYKLINDRLHHLNHGDRVKLVGLLSRDTKQMIKTSLNRVNDDLTMLSNRRIDLAEWDQKLGNILNDNYVIL